jgi:hypothetical protein
MRGLTFLLATVVSLGISGIAPAATFSEDFESYAVGDLHGQGGWKGWDNAATAGAKVSTKFAHSGTKSVEIASASDFVHEFKQAGGKWIFSAWQYIPSGGTGISYFILLNTYVDGGPNDWSIQTQYNLATGAVTCWHGGLSGAAEIIFDRWVEIRLQINLDKNIFDEYYNGQLIATGQWDDNTHGTFQAVDLFGNGASPIYYDDIRIETYHAYAASNPQPAHGATDVTTPVFEWTPGDLALFHDVYLGENPELTLADKVASRLSYPLYYHLAGVEPNAVYYWRVDGIGPTGEIYPGDIWAFTTSHAVVVEDFEGYGDEEGHRIYQTWLDGSTNGTGSHIGHASAPFAEQAIVQSGAQSMPLDYNNVNAPFYSEAERVWSTPQDWTVNGGDTLVVFVRGKSQNDASQPLYIGLTDKSNKNGSVVSTEAAILTVTTWTEWRIPLSQFGVNAAAIKKMVIGIGNRDKPTSAGTGLIYIDTIKVVPSTKWLFHPVPLGSNS